MLFKGSYKMLITSAIFLKVANRTRYTQNLCVSFIAEMNNGLTQVACVIIVLKRIDLLGILALKHQRVRSGILICLNIPDRKHLDRPA